MRTQFEPVQFHVCWCGVGVVTPGFGEPTSVPPYMISWLVATSYPAHASHSPVGTVVGCCCVQRAPFRVPVCIPALGRFYAPPPPAMTTWWVAASNAIAE